MTPEFSRPVEAETISEAARTVAITADAAERRRLAGRFRLRSLDRLDASLTLQRRAGVIHVDGTLDAAVVQACVVTDDPLPAKLRTPFHLRVVPDLGLAPVDDGVELTEADCDTLELVNGKLDLGELVAETLALALAPYPRSKAADAVMREREKEQSTDASPFAALAALKADKPT